MAFDEKLAATMREALSNHGGIVEKRMFGGICWMQHGHMLCGTGDNRFMFRVGKEREEEAAALPGAEPVSFSGRKMGGIVWVEAGVAIEADMQPFLDMASEFVASLPPKEKT